MTKKFDVDNMPDENWFYEANKTIEELYISNLTCDNAIEPLTNASVFEHFKCTYCERAEYCYKGSLDFKDLIEPKHLESLKSINEQQISDIIIDLKRTSFNCPECEECELEKDDCESCEGVKLNGFHQFISKMKSIKEMKLIEKFLKIEEKI